VAGVVRGAPVFGGRTFSDIKTLLQTGNRTVLWWGGRRWRRYLDLKKKKFPNHLKKKIISIFNN
jgi:hypothetical protein